VIRLTGHLDVPPGRRAAVAAALPDHIRLTRAEPGCLSFEVTPDGSVDGRFVVCERFASRADFDAHQDRTRRSDWGRITAGLVRDYVIREDAP
jgi:quinol monooxygenase YgiN